MTAPDNDYVDRFTGCLLGMAIGDALCMPYAYTIDSRPTALLRHRPRLDQEGAEKIPQGQFSLNTELALCLLETIVTSDGFIDPELAIYRFEQASLRSDYLASQVEIEAIRRAAVAEEFQAGGVCAGHSYAGPAARVVPVALVHSLADLNVALLVREVLRSVLLTESDPLVVNGALAVAYAIRLAVRGDAPAEALISETLDFIDEDGVARAMRRPGPEPPGDSVEDVVSIAIRAAAESAENLELALTQVIERGGATHLTGAIAGALCGAYLGASRIDRDFIDGLEGRAYLLMAAPALLRTAQLRAGTLFQLRVQ